MWVVKIGGSLADDALLEQWLELLVSHGSGRVVVVPGGGPFADLVRDAQDSWGFNDAIAHEMAVLAMDQYALMLAGIAPRLIPVASGHAIAGVLRNAGVPVWMPSRMLRGAMEVPTSWDVTSDSLAAWLARHLSAERLVLVKSLSPDQLVGDTETLVANGALDTAFPDFIRSACFQTSLISRDQLDDMRAHLIGHDCNPRDGRAPPGVISG